MINKLKSFLRYRSTFQNWWTPAFARYLGRFMAHTVCLTFRDGRILYFRPASDFVALGEIFVADGYARAKSCPPTIRNIWDIGGNLGGFVLWAAKYFPQATFTSFEPCSATFDLLQQTKDANPNLTWRIHGYGLSSKSETCTARVPDGHFGEASRFATEGALCTFDLKSLDEVWNQHGSPDIGLLKVDCEGGEHEIFLNCSSEFLAHVDAIIMEVHPIPGHRSEEIKVRLERENFTLSWFQGPQGVVYAQKNVGRDTIHTTITNQNLLPNEFSQYP
jgi:FkbM family methyltransferase